MLGHTDVPHLKPLDLVKALIRQATTPGGGDLVLDVFAGSGTAGHAVLALNAVGRGNCGTDEMR